MNATPAMCQYAEIVLSMAVMLTFDRFSSTAISITTEYVRSVHSLVFG